MSVGGDTSEMISGEVVAVDEDAAGDSEGDEISFSSLVTTFSSPSPDSLLRLLPSFTAPVPD